MSSLCEFVGARNVVVMLGGVLRVAVVVLLFIDVVVVVVCVVRARRSLRVRTMAFVLDQGAYRLR